MLTAQISAGEMPLNAAGLEVQLSRIFDTTVHWGALLLLDEADVFLERRSSQDLVRNSLVAVFLRRLEYCQGIMFMTSNRASEFDEAALSRIHLMLRYGNLDLQAKTEIWRNFLNMANTSQGKAIVSDKEFERLVSTKFNGRQVRVRFVLRKLSNKPVIRSRTSLRQPMRWLPKTILSCPFRTFNRLLKQMRNSFASSPTQITLIACSLDLILMDTELVNAEELSRVETVKTSNDKAIRRGE